MKERNRFDDLAVGDTVVSHGYHHISLPSGAFIVNTISADGKTLTVELANPKRGEAKVSYGCRPCDVKFGCHNEGAPFTNYAHTEESGYRDGFESGFNWNMAKWNHRPGGPGHHRSKATHCRHLEAYLEAQEANHNGYMKGWDDGQAARNQGPVDITKPLFMDTGEEVKLLDYNPTFAVVEIPRKHQPHVARQKSGSNSHQIKCRINTGVCIHNHAFYIRNEVPMSHTSRIRYGLMTSGGCPYISQEEASRAFIQAHGVHTDREQTVLRFTQEAVFGSGWKTLAVEPLPLIVPPIVKLYDMGMNPISAALKTDSHVVATLIGGIVSQVEIVHPS